METNREIARREPPAGLGLLACTAGASALCRVCHKIKRGNAGDKLYTDLTDVCLPFAGLLPNGAALPFQNRGNIS